MTPEQTTPEVRAYIEEEKAKIEVPSYDAIVTNQAFKGRTAGYWAGTAMGFAWGSVVGIAAAAVTAIAIPTASFALLGGIVALTAATGSAVGVVSGQIIGAAAGAVRGGFLEYERRQKAAALEEQLMQDPSLKQKALEAARTRDENSPLILKADRSLRVEEMWKRSNGAVDFAGNLFAPKTLMVSSTAGAILGAVWMIGALYAGGTAAGVYPSLASILAPTALVAESTKLLAGAAIGAVTGASFGFNFPAVFTSLSRYAGATLSEKIFAKEFWQKDKAKAVAIPEADIVQAFPNLNSAKNEATYSIESEPTRRFQAMLQNQQLQQEKSATLIGR
jgi:hypothetical protein